MQSLDGKSKIVLVEGKDEKNVVKSILKYILNGENYYDIEIMDVKGRSNFRKELKTISNITGFNDVDVIAIIMDAEDNFDSTLQSISGALDTINIISPKELGEFSDNKPSVGIFIMPDNNCDGMLEDLFLKSKEEESIFECVEKYIDCVKEKNASKIKKQKLSKTKSQLYLAAMDKDSRSIGEAACQGYWDFEHDCFKDIIRFMQLFVEA